jgi:hypothetical protein
MNVLAPNYSLKVAQRLFKSSTLNWFESGAKMFTNGAEKCFVRGAKKWRHSVHQGEH